MKNPYAPPDPTKPRPVRPPSARAPRPQRPSPPAPEPPKLSPEEIRSVTRTTLVFGVLMMATLLAGGLPVPWQLLGPAVGIVTIVYGLRTLSRVRKLRWPGMLTPMLIGGLLLTSLTTVSTTTQLTMFWDEQLDYQQCRAEAVSIAAQNRCVQQWQEARTAQQTR